MTPWSDSLRRPLPCPSTPLESFTYDALGNRLDSTQNGAAQFNAGNQLLDDAHFTYQYDANGNLTRKTAKADGEFTTYAYDAENHLIQVVLPTGTTVHYRYDALGRRIEKVVVNGTTTVTQYVYDHEDILLERDGNHAIIARYTHGPGIDEPLLLSKTGSGMSITPMAWARSPPSPMRRAWCSSTTPTPPSAPSRRNWTRALCSPTPSRAGSLTPKRGCTIIGRARMMPPPGAFSSVTPSALPGGNELYAYVGGNPLSRTDPTGLFFDSMGQVVGQATRMCVSAASATAAAVVAGVVVVLWPTATAECDVIEPPAGSDCGKDGPDCKLASRYHLVRAGITDAHAFKREYLGEKGPIKYYDICACKDGSITIAAKRRMWKTRCQDRDLRKVEIDMRARVQICAHGTEEGIRLLHSSVHMAGVVSSCMPSAARHRVNAGCLDMAAADQERSSPTILRRSLRPYSALFRSGHCKGAIAGRCVQSYN